MAAISMRHMSAVVDHSLKTRRSRHQTCDTMKSGRDMVKSRSPSSPEDSSKS